MLDKCILVGRQIRKKCAVSLTIYVLMLFFPAIAAHALEYVVEEFVPGVFVHVGRHEEMRIDNQGDIGNAGFIVGSESVAVIDPGGSVAVAMALKKALDKRTDLPVKYLILTHFHPDHVTGASVFEDAEITIAHKNYPRAVLQRSTYYLQRFAPLAEDVSPDTFGSPNRLVTDRLRINLGDRPLVLMAYSTAHTDNDLTVFDVNTNMLWASDLVFSTRLPSLDGSLTGWLKVISKLSAEGYQWVVPGHGLPARWNAAVDPQTAYLEMLRDTIRAQLATGLTLSDSIKAGVASFDQNWLMYEQQHPTNITKAYTELEWE